MTLPIKVATSPCADIFNAAFEGNLSTLKDLLNSPAKPVSVNVKDEDQRQPLHWACTGNQLHVAEELLVLGADVNARDDSDWAPAHICASSGRFQILTLLIEKGANVDAQTENGLTPLHYAASKGHVECCRKLLNANAKCLLDNQGQAPLHRACSAGQVAVVKMLMDNAQHKSSSTIKDRQGNTSVHLACEGDFGDILTALVGDLTPDQQMSLLQQKNNEQKTPADLCSSAFKGYIQRIVGAA